MEYTEQLENRIKDRLRTDNPWWSTGKTPEYFSKMSPRKYLDPFMSLLNEINLRRAIVLMGARRVGKTVMMVHAIQGLLDNGVTAQNIIYVPLDAPIYNGVDLEQLLLLACNILGKNSIEDTVYVFFDEIQYLKNWEINLKSLVDTFLNAKFVASGSAAAELKMRSNDSGAGRFTDFHLPPLTFYEFIHLSGHSGLMTPSMVEWKGESVQVYNTINIAQLNSLFLDYINYGGFLEIAFSKEVRDQMGQFIRHDIIDKVLLRDLPNLYGISDVQELNSLFTMIAYRSGAQFSYETLSKESGVKKETLKKYIEYLEAAFLISMVKRSDDTAKSYQRDTQFKLYLTNPSTHCALFCPIEGYDEEIGNMVETAVYSQWLPRHDEIRYANWRQGRKQGEVDMVGLDLARQKPSWAVEIKWSDRFFEHPQDLDSLEYFMDRNGLDSAIVTSISKTGTVEVGGKKLLFIPAACYCYTVGEGTINGERSFFGL